MTAKLAVIAVTGALLQVGLPTLAGTRDNMPEFTGWAGRAMRASEEYSKLGAVCRRHHRREARQRLQ